MTVGLRALCVTLILAAVAWTTREVTGFGFLPLVDDDVNIFFNPHLGAPDASRLRWMATDFSYVHRYMPLGWLGFSLVYAVSGLDPWGYHAAGVALHALNAVLVFLIIGRLLRRFGHGAPERDRIACACLAALLWAVHPLRVETTSWCSGLLYSQAGFLALLCACGRLAELRARDEGRRGWAGAYFVLGFLAYVLSVLTYPVALFLPFALALLDHAWLAGGDNAGPRRAARLGMAVYAVAAVAGLALTVHARATAMISWLRAPTVAEFGLVSRLLQACYVAAVYVWRTCWTGDLRWMPLTLFDADAARVPGFVAALFLLGVTLWAWRERATAPYILACWASYLVLVTPNLGLSEHPHTIADRYLYITGVVFSVALAMALVRLRSRASRVALGCAGAAAVVVCALVSVSESRVWRNTDTFQERMMRNPDSDLDHITAARAGKLRFLEGDVRGGRDAVRGELARAPSVGGVILTWRQIAPSSPMSAEVAATRLQEWPTAPFAYAHQQIALAQLDEGRNRDALLHLDAALVVAPDYAEARFERGMVFAASGAAGSALHDWLFLRRAWGARPAQAARLSYMGRRIASAYAAEGNGRYARLLGGAGP